MNPKQQPPEQWLRLPATNRSQKNQCRLGPAEMNTKRGQAQAIPKPPLTNEIS